MKKLIIISFLYLLIFPIVFADDYDIYQFTVNILVDDEEMDTFDYEQNIDLPGFIYEGRTMLPLKKTFELFGISSENIKWDKEERSVLITTNNDDEIWMQIDNVELKFNDSPIETDVPAKIFNNRTFVPVAFISKLLGVTPAWDAKTRTVQMNPSTHALSEFGVTFEFNRRYAYSVPELDVSSNTYVMEKLSDDIFTKNKFVFMSYENDSVYNVILANAKANYLSSEDYNPLSQKTLSYYRAIGENDYYSAVDVGTGTVIMETFNVELDIVKDIIESMRGER